MPNLKLERIHLNQFLKLFFPEKVIAKPQNTPEPDFLVVTEKLKIGIEHTQLIRKPDQNGVNIMGHSQIANKIMREAERLFNESYDFCLMVHVDFRCDYGLAITNPMQLSNKDIKELSLYISEFVGQQLGKVKQLKLGDQITFETYDWNTSEKILPDKINDITIYNTETFTQSAWFPYQGGVVPKIYESIEFKNTLQNKNKKPTNYKEKYSEIWLLIVEDSMDLNSYFHFEDQKDIQIETTFDRVFILRRAENIFFELQKRAFKS